ncbi:MAG: hypothetical protein QOF60_872, partial [Actinomycetota bacterium]|nr:hypothetical protein [Actinomycetota bacterium]
MTHDRRRQVLLRLVALAASLAALAGIAYVLRSPDSRTDVRASGSPPRQSDAGADTQSPTTTGASASTTTTTQAAATSTTTAGTSGATLDPKPATWTAASASFTATVAVSATSLHVADVAHFVVTVEDEAGSLLRVGIDYGDGTPTGVPAPTHVDCHAAGEGASTTDRVHKQVTFDHAYRRAVTVAPRVVARSDGCNRSERALEATGELHVLAIAGAIPTNGPLRPTLTIDQNTSTNSTERAVSIVVAG